jgi:hypothetical protein
MPLGYSGLIFMFAERNFGVEFVNALQAQSIGFKTKI